MKIRTIIVIGLLLGLSALRLLGCIYNVRDVGFVEIISHPYRLYFFMEDDTPEELTAQFNQIAYPTFMDSNVDVEIIHIDQEKDHPAMEYFDFWEIRELPVAILISPTGRSMVLPLSFSENSLERSARNSLESVVSSSARGEILNHIVRAYGIILLIEGKNAAENKRGYDVAVSAVQKIARIMNQLPKRIEEPPRVIVISQEMASKEKILLWSLDLDENQLDEPCLAVIYGRARRIGPLLKGDQITDSTVFNILSIIGLSCECGLDKKWMIGPRLPLRWGEKIQQEAVNLLGFDAESPMVKTEMSNMLSFDYYTKVENRGTTQGSENPFDRYREELIEFESELAEKRITPAQFREIITSESAGSQSGLNWRRIIFLTGIVVLCILAGGVLILLRARRKAS